MWLVGWLVGCQAAPEALKAIEANFPGSVQDEVFIHACAEELFHLGFNQ